MADWARRSTKWHHNLMALGDFNIDRQGDAAWNAFASTGLTVPDDLNKVPRSIFADPGTPTLDKFYDQIAWFTETSGSIALSMEYAGGGSFNFVPQVYTGTGLTKNSVSHRISDHYPLWVEFGAVIIPILTQHFKMLFRNLIYTGLTRAKNLAVFVGTRKALAMAVKNQDTSQRQTFLEKLLRRQLVA
jgi:hypothetical protein